MHSHNQSASSAQDLVLKQAVSTDYMAFSSCNFEITQLQALRLYRAGTSQRSGARLLEGVSGPSC